MRITNVRILKISGLAFLFISLLFVLVFIVKSSQSVSAFSNSTVEFIEGMQTIKIKAGLGYSPNKIQAQANIPSELQIETDNTYDCTAFLNIPKLNIKEFLPPTGVTKIPLLGMSTGEELEGFCGSDTYKFVIKFS